MLFDTLMPNDKTNNKWKVINLSILLITLISAIGLGGLYLEINDYSQKILKNEVNSQFDHNKLSIEYSLNLNWKQLENFISNLANNKRFSQLIKSNQKQPTLNEADSIILFSEIEQSEILFITKNNKVWLNLSLGMYSKKTLNSIVQNVNNDDASIYSFVDDQKQIKLYQVSSKEILSQDGEVIATITGATIINNNLNIYSKIIQILNNKDFLITYNNKPIVGFYQEFTKHIAKSQIGLRFTDTPYNLIEQHTKANTIYCKSYPLHNNKTQNKLNIILASPLKKAPTTFKYKFPILTVAYIIIILIILLFFSFFINKPLSKLLTYIRNSETAYTNIKPFTKTVVKDFNVIGNAIEKAFRHIQTQRDNVIKSRNNLTDIIDSMPAIIFVIDHKLIITTANRAASKIINLDIRRIAGRPLFEYINVLNPFKKEIEKTIGCKCITTKENITLQLENNNTTRQVNITFYPISQGAVIIINDVSEYVKFQEEVKQQLRKEVANRTNELAKVKAELLQQANESGKSEIATNIVHLFGNSLVLANTAYDNLSSNLNDELKAFERLNQEFNQIKNNPNLDIEHKSRHLSILGTSFYKGILKLHGDINIQQNELKHCLDLISQTITSQKKLTRYPEFDLKFNLTNMITELLLFKQNALINNISLINEINANINIKLNKSKLAHVFIELLNNAIESLEENPNQNIEVKLSGNETQGIKITISNKGVAIPAKNKDSIFQYGFTTKNKHYGFGLHNAFNMMCEIGGHLSLLETDNTTLPETTFMVKIPPEKIIKINPKN